MSSALTIAGSMQADALLATAKLLDSWRSLQWHQLAQAFLMYVTWKWPDVLSTAAGSAATGDRHATAVTAVCAGSPAAAISGEGEWPGLDQVDVIGHSGSSGRHCSPRRSDRPIFRCWSPTWHYARRWCTGSFA